jgi:hypothetical protein
VLLFWKWTLVLTRDIGASGSLQTGSQDEIPIETEPLSMKGT